MEDRLKKWRLILGKHTDPEQSVPLSGDELGKDQVLEALYDSDRKGNLGSTMPKVNRWLGDIRKYFKTSMVQVMQQDAMERLGIEKMLLEPELLEAIEPDVHLVGTLLSLNKVMPSKTRETARKVVEAVVRELEKKLSNPMRQAIAGSLSRAVRNTRPKSNEIDWGKTIMKNLKHYQPKYKTVVPEQLIGYGKKGKALRTIILLVDQSGSMATSVVYAGVYGAVLASLKSVKTHLVVFDTSVVDLTNELHDPVDLLFATQLGGGTDINKALTYSQQLIKSPGETIFVLLSDLFEGGREEEMLKRAASIKASGVQMVTLLSLNDQGAPSFDRQNARKLTAMGIPCFSCTPNLFPDLMSSVIKQEDINNWMARHHVESKG